MPTLFCPPIKALYVYCHTAEQACTAKSWMVETVRKTHNNPIGEMQGGVKSFDKQVLQKIFRQFGKVKTGGDGVCDCPDWQYHAV